MGFSSTQLYYCTSHVTFRIVPKTEHFILFIKRQSFAIFRKNALHGTLKYVSKDNRDGEKPQGRNNTLDDF